MDNNIDFSFCKDINLDYDYDFWDKLLDVKVNDDGSFKVIRWNEYKSLSLLLADSFKRLGNDKYYRVLNCGSNLVFKRFEDGSLKLHQADFCKVRLCPMCSWRRSLKIFAQVSKVMSSVGDDYEFLFLTLTCKNVFGDDLSRQLDILFSSFRSLTSRKGFKASVKGWFRCLEVTHNWQNNTFHPHFHVILVVNKSYFSDTRYYLSQKRWVQLWKNCLNVDYDPVVDIRRFRRSKRGVGKEVAEVAKYAVKPSDLFLRDNLGHLDEESSDAVISVLDKALSYRRLIAFGGVLKDIHKQLNLDDVESGNLVMTDVDEMREDLSYILVRYRWHIGYSNYYRFD